MVAGPCQGRLGGRTFPSPPGLLPLSCEGSNFRRSGGSPPPRTTRADRRAGPGPTSAGPGIAGGRRPALPAAPQLRSPLPAPAARRSPAFLRGGRPGQSRSRNSVSNRLICDRSRASRCPMARASRRSTQPSGRWRNRREADAPPESDSASISSNASARSQSEASSSASNLLTKGAGSLPERPAISRSLAGMSLSSIRRRARRAASTAGVSN